MTKLKYLEDSDLFKSKAVFLGTKENEKGKAIVLDETIFYPQGGGQPADTGKIYSDNAFFDVTGTRLDEDGTVWHFGEFTKGEFKPGEEVILEIDQVKRALNTKLHSAGHLIDCAVTQLNLKSLKPTKGFHFPEGPYVEYEGIIDNPDELVPAIQKNLDELLTQNIPVEIEELSVDEAKSRGIWAPAGKSARIVSFKGFPSCGCGGTHVKSSLELGKIFIKKISSKKGRTRVSYELGV